MPPYASPQTYRDSAVLTATPAQLVVMLYDGANRFLRQAEVVMAEGAYSHASERLQRAEAIIDELLHTLNMDAGEISVSLQAIYLFCRRHLSEARLERSAHKIGEVRTLLGDLRDAWAQISQDAGAAAISA
jgi:flagellar secretion chaperone FliS